MFYTGPSIFSYGTHWELARLVTLQDTRLCVALCNDGSRSRSNSTARHYWKVYAALRSRCIPEVEILGHLIPGVTDSKSLDAARKETAEYHEREKEERRERERETEKRRRDDRGYLYREELARKLEIEDLSALSNSAASKLRTALFGSEQYVFGRQRYWASRVSREQAPGTNNPELIKAIAEKIRENPDKVLKKPGVLFKLINNLQLLAS
jgi:hypothetical protein